MTNPARQLPTQRIETALEAMGAIVADLTIPLPVRRKVWGAYVVLHACRDQVSVRRIEKAKGLRK